jgi:hypothetical protein
MQQSLTNFPVTKRLVKFSEYLKLICSTRVHMSPKQLTQELLASFKKLWLKKTREENMLMYAEQK